MSAVLSVAGPPGAANDEAPDRASDRGLREENSGLDSLTTDVQRKRFTTLQAQLALRGFSVVEVHDGYLVIRWDRSRVLPCLRSLSEFARLVGAES